MKVKTLIDFGGVVKVSQIMLIIMVLLCISAAKEKNIQKDLDTFIAQKKYNTKGLAVAIVNMDNDSFYLKINENEPMNPASVTKLVTGSAAYELLGLNFQFSTKVYINGTYDRDSGIVHGGLCIVGGGDPGFTAERIWLFTQHLYHLGIRKINGDIIIDDSFFDSVAIGPGFGEDSSSRAYQPLINALPASFNTVAVHTRTGSVPGGPVIVDIFPKIQGITVTSTAKVAASGKKNTLDIITLGTSKGTNVVIKGDLPIGETPRYAYRKVWQTWQTFGGALLTQLSESGIKCSGGIINQVTPDSLKKQTPFYVFTSQSINQYVNEMFKYSSNFTAEMLFKTIAAVQDSGVGTWNAASNVVSQWWQVAKLPGTPVIKNGSGMGNLNRLSAFQITSLLGHVWNQKVYLPEYLSALCVAGIDGTLKSRFKNSPIKGLIRGKTGTLNDYGVSTLAGYILLPQQTFAFAILCNKVGKGQWDNWATQELILEKFCEMVQEN
jgi:D-alanyl-D-alanine carboxypeptidase/D-alanyl-D-alanine-endopeptidase (penicillin-binding protein 4)